MNDSFVPPKKRVLLLSIAVLMAGICSIAMLLKMQLQTPHVISPNEYVQGTAPNFKFSCDITLQSGVYEFTGYAFLDSTILLNLNTQIVLYHAPSNVYLSLPTQAILNYDAPKASAKGLEHYAISGFTACVSQKKLKYPISEYELYVAYQDDARALLCETAQALA